ncbi:MAG: Gfo/Idh/MocA family protein [Planctomycetota bacterium]
MSADALRTVIVGSGRMGLAHGKVLAGMEEFEVTAVSDLDPDAATELAAELNGATAYTVLEEMLDAESPDLAVVATPGATHGEIVPRVAEAGVAGICCEKPMADSLGDGRRMVEACRQNGAALIVGHQRRMGADLVEMRRLIREGAVGEVYLLRGTCAGDMLGDGTHVIDSLRWLSGDEGTRWVLGQVYREPPPPDEPKGMGHVRSGGWRYGYPVETGAVATFELQSGVRVELLTGDVRLPGRSYQDYEVFGTEGRLWRPGDDADPPVLIWEEQPGGWREAPIDPDAAGEPRVEMYGQLAQTIRKGSPHPLSGESALKGLEIIMAVHESARLTDRISLPLGQERFPLRMMIDEGRL